MVHRGEIVDKAVRDSGYPITKLAEKLGISRKTIYNKLDSANLDYELILKIGRIIGHDFTNDFPNMFNPVADADEHKNYPPADDVNRVEEVNGMYRPATLKDCEKELIQIQRKYINLLESHNELLRSTGTTGA